MKNNNQLTDIARKYGLFELTCNQYPLVAPWFAAIDGADIRLASVEAKGGGKLYADDPINPAAVWMAADDGFGYLAGDADAPGFAEGVVNRLVNEMLPARAPGDRQAIVFSSDDAWKVKLDALFAPHGGFRIRRHAFAFDKAAYRAACAALPKLPDGYEIRALPGGRFDTGVFAGAEEAASCREVFSGAGRAEIDVHTAEPHRRRGLALRACAAFIGKCLEAGMAPHWSCWDYNAPSVALALRLGFRQLPDLEVNFCDLG